MANNRIVMEGLDDLRAALRSLPEDLATEAGGIIRQTAIEAKAEIVAAYPARTGNLRKGVKIVHTSNPVSVQAIVKNTAKHAYLFEMGTQARHTNLGANRGTMPPGRVFIPIAIRKRRQMYEQLKALLVRAGAVVTGA